MICTASCIFAQMLCAHMWNTAGFWTCIMMDVFFTSRNAQWDAWHFRSMQGPSLYARLCHGWQNVIILDSCLSIAHPIPWQTQITPTTFPSPVGAQNGIAKECELRQSADLSLLISNQGRNPLWGWPNTSRASSHCCSETGKPGLIVMCWAICLWHQYYLEHCWRRSGLEQEMPLSVITSAAGGLVKMQVPMRQV